MVLCFCSPNLTGMVAYSSAQLFVPDGSVSHPILENTSHITWCVQGVCRVHEASFWQ